MIKLLKKYTNIFSVSSRETKFAAAVSEDVKQFSDDVYTDAMGNLIVFKKGKNNDKKLMLAAHMDEIGFVVTFIDDNGYIRIAPIGGVNPIAAAFSKVVFENNTIGILIPETGTANADIAVAKLLVDIGAKSKKEAEKLVSIGDYLALQNDFFKLSKTRYCAKAFDDRIACAVFVKIIRELTTCAYDTYFVFTTQEEVGCRGSKTAAFNIMPDYALALDVTLTGDTIGAVPMAVKLSGGAAIKIKDSSVICSKLIIDALTNCAVKHNIPYQYEVLLSGGTDTSSMQMNGSGAFAGAVSIPTRYVHSPVETVDIEDVNACVKLLSAIIEEGI